jgi:transglutaminase superfamily protein
LCRCVDLACVFYLKPVLCLQRSAATTLILRNHGWKAQLVIGAQPFPFKSHAWVEIDQEVINDRPYMAEIYQVLDRC